MPKPVVAAWRAILEAANRHASESLTEEREALVKEQAELEADKDRTRKNKELVSAVFTALKDQVAMYRRMLGSTQRKNHTKLGRKRVKAKEVASS